MDDLELIGMDYIWRLVLNSCEDIANKAIELLKDCFTNLGPRLQTSQVDIHDDFISSCFDRLRASYDTITLLEQEKDIKFGQEATKLCRVLKVLYEYVQECDADFCDERTLVPLFRAPRGKQLILLFRYVLSFNTYFLTDSYIGFTLKMESVSIFGLKMMVKSGLKKFILKSLHVGRELFSLLNLLFWALL